MATKVATNSSKQDLRAWLAECEAAGDLQHVSGADREEEIGGILDVYQRKMGRPTLLFDNVPGYQPGFRVCANVLTSPALHSKPHGKQARKDTYSRFHRSG